MNTLSSSDQRRWKRSTVYRDCKPVAGSAKRDNTIATKSVDALTLPVGVRAASVAMSTPSNSIAATSAPLVATNMEKSPQRICYGRVQNLESNVPVQWWTSVFSDSLYLKTDGDVVEDPDITDSEVQILESFPQLQKIFRRGMASSKESTPRILDLCCGQGRHALELAKRYPRLQVFGHDQSEYLIELARERAQQNAAGDRCTFTVGDCRTIPYEDSSFDLVIIMGNSFGYFSSTASDLCVLEECHRVLKCSDINVSGYLVLDLTDGFFMRHNYSPRTWEWIDDHTFVCRERQLSKDGKCLVSREVVTDTEKGVVRDQFYMERLYARDEMEMLMEMVGFNVAREKKNDNLIQHQSNSVQQKGDTVTAAKDLSKRGEDLGMMEQRMLVMAIKESKEAKNGNITTTTTTQRATAMKPASYNDSKIDVRECYDKLVVETRSDDTTTQLVNYDQSSIDSAISVLSNSSLEGDASNSPASSITDDNDRADSVDYLRQYEHALCSLRVFPTELPKMKRLVVVIGDSSIPCPGKLNNTWNEEDHITRRKLFDVLSSHWTPHPNATMAATVDFVRLNNDVNSEATTGDAIGTLTIVDKHSKLIQSLLSLSQTVDDANDGIFVVNLCDEGFANDALQELHVPALLDMLKLPYSGAGPQCLAFCYDKGLVNRTAAALGVPTPSETYVLNSPGYRSETPQVHNVAYFDTLLTRHKIVYPAFVKPLRGDNSLGITSRSLVHSSDELQAYIMQLYNSSIQDVVVQEYLSGPEFSVGVVGNPGLGYHFFPVLQVDYSAIVQQNLVPILGYESKWDPQSPYWKDVKYIRANLPVDVELKLKTWCMLLFERFGCRDYARFDFRAHSSFEDLCAEFTSFDDQYTNGHLHEGKSDKSKKNGHRHYHDGTHSSTSGNLGAEHPSLLVKLLEVNPNPGWCWDGKLAYMAKLEGISYAEFLMMVLNVAWARVAQT